jgi:hypothetical protein
MTVDTQVFSRVCACGCVLGALRDGLMRVRLPVHCVRVLARPRVWAPYVVMRGAVDP